MEYRERKTKTAERALADLMKYASKAERSGGDAMRLMRTWGVPEVDRAKVLERLVRDRFIDDRRFAAAYVREKSRLAGWGTHKIVAGLRAKGIAKDVAADAVAAEYDTADAADRLTELLLRKAKSINGGTKYEIKGKLMRFGLSRGYEYDTVAEAVERVADGSAEWRG